MILFGASRRKILKILFDYKLYASAVDEGFYKNQLRGARLPFLSPALHYLIFGARRGLSPNRLFDTKFYLKNYDGLRGGENPLAHYLRKGWREKKNPSQEFDTAWYLQRYADVQNAGVNPLLHFLAHGRAEGRLAKPPPCMLAIIEDASFLICTEEEPSTEAPTVLSLDDFASSAQLKRIDRANWVSTGNDPHWTLDFTVPAGFVRVRIDLTCESIRSSAVREVVAEIFFDQGRGIRQDEGFTFLFDGRHVAVDALLFLENETVSVRFDPVNTECNLSVKTFEIATVDVGVAIRHLYAKYCWKNDEPLRTDQEFLDQLRPDNIISFVRGQADAIDHGTDRYQRWIEARRLSPSERGRLSEAATAGPVFSILMPTYKSDLVFLKKAVDSVRAQTYGRWELCIIDDGSENVALDNFIKRQASKDKRVHYKRSRHNVGIAAATNQALAMARGDFIALLDHDDELALHALSAMAAAIARQPDADMLYSDEDKIDGDGVRSGPLFKPDWSPEFFLSCMYTCHLGVYRRSLVEAVGGFRTEFDLAQDYDLALRVSARARAIVHVADVLYHWRMSPTSTASGAEAKPTAELAARRAVQAHVDAQGLSGHVVPGPIPGTHRVKLDLLGSPLITIVIPTAARRLDPDVPRWYLLDLLRSIHERTIYPCFEIVLVENGDIEPALQEELSAFETVRVTYREPVFNISEKMNLGVAAARGEYVVLLNDDMTIITPDWLEEMIAWLQRPGIVGVGGKLLFPDDRIQHAGILMLAQGPSHVYYEAADVDAGLVGSALTHRNYAAVTGACLAVRKTDYEAIGGFDPAFRINYNDIDFCLRLGELGRIVYTGFAKLYHYESVSKGEVIATELGHLKDKWADRLGMDPYYNIHLSQSAPNSVTLRPLAPG